MGRITPSFRQMFLRELRRLRNKRKGFYNTLRDPKHKEAFDALIRDAWQPESAAMVQSDLYGVIDDMNLMASVNVKKEIEALKEKIKEMEDYLQEIVE
jgi:hypothetical protein